MAYDQNKRDDETDVASPPKITPPKVDSVGTSEAAPPAIQRPDTAADSTPMMSVGGGQPTAPQSGFASLTPAQQARSETGFGRFLNAVQAPTPPDSALTDRQRGRPDSALGRLMNAMDYYQPPDNYKPPSTINDALISNPFRPPAPAPQAPAATQPAKAPAPPAAASATVPVSRPGGAIAAAIPAAVSAAPAPATNPTDPSTWSPGAKAAFDSQTPGTAVINGRVISPEEIQRLANTNVISSEAFVNPGAGVAMSEATGGRFTPQLGGAGTIQRPAVDPIRAAYDTALADQQDAARSAQSRMADIASGDWRSAAGTQARNAMADLQSAMSSGGNSRADIQKRQIAQQVYQNRMSALLGGGMAPAEETAKLAGQYQRDVGEQQRGLAAATERAQAAAMEREIRRPGLVQVPMADGSLGLLGTDGIVRPAIGADGKPVRTAKAPDVETAKTAVERQQQLAKTTEQVLQNDDLQRKPGTAPMSISQARMRAYQIHGAVPPANEWIAAARELNPNMSDKDLAARYNQRYSQQ